MWDKTKSCSESAFLIRSWMAAFKLPLKYGLTIFSVNSESKEAGTLWNVKSTKRSFSAASTTVFFIRNHLGLVLWFRVLKRQVNKLPRRVVER